MRPPHAHRITTTAIALAIALAACSFNNGYVLDVTIDGGDRTLALGEPLTLTATVTFGNGATDRVTWTTSDDTIATIDTNGLVTTLAQGPTQITATSTSDPSKNDAITLTITEPNAVTNLTIDGGDRTIVLGDPLSLTATITTTGAANDAITWTSSDQTVATIDATGTVTSITDGTTDLTASSVFDPTQSDTITLTIDPPGALRWTRQFGTSNSDYAYGVATDTNGRIYVTGVTGNDAFLNAYDADGTEVWTLQFGTGAFDIAYGVATDPNGNVYVAGYTFGNLEGTSAGFEDAFLRAYDPNGTELWTRQFGTDTNDIAYGVATDTNGRIYVTGATGNDAFLNAYDADGTEVWTQQFGTSGFDLANGVTTDANGNVYVTGYTSGALEGINIGDTDAFLRAYDPNGNEVWTQQFGTDTIDVAHGVVTDTNGNVYVTGNTDGDLDGPNAGVNDAFLRAYEPNGDLLWGMQFGDSASDYPRSVSTDANGHIYVTGHTYSDLEGQNVGVTDAFLSAHDPNGDVLWTRQFGTADFDYALAVAMGANGDILVTGWTFGALEPASPGGIDAFLRAYGR